MVIEFVIELVAKFETEFKQTFLDTETERNKNKKKNKMKIVNWEKIITENKINWFGFELKVLSVVIIQIFINE